MRVVCPYTEMTVACRMALDASGYDWEPVKMTDDFTYGRMLADLWSYGETFCIIEQDVVVQPGTLAEMDGCQERWCAYPTGYMGSYLWGLSCVKFGAGLLARYPNAVIEANQIDIPPLHPPGHWCTRDHCLQRMVLEQKYREQFHRHWVEGENPCLQHRDGGQDIWPSHGCVPRT